MVKSFTKIYSNLSQKLITALYNDKINRFFVVFSFLSIFIILYIWRKIFMVREVIFYSSTNYSPFRFIVVVAVLHLAISLYSYKNDKKISHLLMGTLSIYCLLLLALELFYLTIIR